MMRKVSLTVLFALTAMLSACGDNSVSPHNRAPEVETAAVEGYRGALSSTDTAKFSITIDPWRSTTYYVGDGNSLYFPAGSVCDPSSTYGVAEWDRPCAPIRSSVTVSVKAWMDAQGHARVDFLPHLRFVPSVLPAGWVNITFADFQASLSPFYNILYCPTGMSQCYDESKSDPTLLTVRNAITGKVTRRIKHFSGYMVGAGDDSTSSGGEMNRIGLGATLSAPSMIERGGKDQDRTGYMLASGRQEQ
jgi:hypothetical protein